MEIRSVRKTYMMEKQYIESNMSLFVTVAFIDYNHYIPTKMRKFSA